MDKTNKSNNSNANRSNRANNTQRQRTQRGSNSRQTPAAPPAAQLAQAAPSLDSLQNPAARFVQGSEKKAEAIRQVREDMTTQLEPILRIQAEMKSIQLNKKLDFSCRLLLPLVTAVKTDRSAIDKIIQLLNNKDKETQQTLIEQFENNQHEQGLEIVRTFCECIPAILEERKNQSYKTLEERQAVLDILRLTVGKKSTFTAAYGTNDRTDIDRVEAILMKLLNEQVEASGSSDSLFERYVFQLVQVINRESVGTISNHLFKYCNNLEWGLWNETTPEQFALYFVYGLLGKNHDVLGRLFSCLSACPHTDFKEKAEENSIRLFGYFLDDLQEAYIKDLKVDPNSYDDAILYACNSFPKLVDACSRKLCLHMRVYYSHELFWDLLVVKNSAEQCLWDFLYSGDSEGYNRALENFLTCSSDMINSVDNLIRIKNLELRNVLNYLSTVAIPDGSMAHDIKFRYLILSILLRDISCIERFKDVQLETEDETKRLEAALKQLMLWHLDDSSLDLLLSAELSKKALFFKALEALKPLGVLNNLDFMAHVLYFALRKDQAMDMMGTTTPIFDNTLKVLQDIGFDLYQIDRTTDENILFWSLEIGRKLGDYSFIKRLIELKINPFWMSKNFPYSVFGRLSVGNDGVAARAILQYLGLDQHLFLDPNFRKNIFTNNRLDRLDTEGRTPVMLYVMTGMSITKMFGKKLEKLRLKDLEAKDNKGWTVFDYAKHNNDQEALALLNNRKTVLEEAAKPGARKAGKKPSIFSQAAVAFNLVRDKAPVGVTPIANEGSKKNHGKPRQKAPVPSAQASVPSIDLYYDEGTGRVQTETKAAREAAQQALNREADKQKKKEDRAADVEPTLNKKKEGLIGKAKTKIKNLATSLETAKNIVSNPQAFVQTLASKLSQAKAGERLGAKQTVYNLGQAKPLARIEDGLWLGGFVSLEDLANETLGKNLLNTPSSGVVKTLAAMDHAMGMGKSGKINRFDILAALQWALGGSIEEGHGSHLNLRYPGGLLTIPHNRDGSENADIVYIKKAAGLMTQKLRGLLLGYEASQASSTSEDLSGSNEWNGTSSSKTSSSEERKAETPEPSGSEESER